MANIKDLKAKLQSSEQFMFDNTEHFDEYKIIVSKQALTKVDGKPEITTSTLANDIEKLAYQTIQELPKGEVVDRWGDENQQATICEYFLHLIRNENTPNELALKEKVISVFKEACTLGYCAVFISTDENHAGIEIPILEPIAYSDYFPEPNCGIIHNAKWTIVRKWYSKAQLEDMKDIWSNVSKVLKKTPEQRYGDGSNQLSDYSQQNKTNVQMYQIYVYTDQKGGFIVFDKDTDTILFEEKNYFGMNSMRVIPLAIMPDDVNTLGTSLIEQNANTQLALDTALQDSVADFNYDRNPASVIVGHVQGEVDLEEYGQNFIPDGSGDIRYIKRQNSVQEFIAMSQTLNELIDNSTGLASINISAGNNLQGASKTHAGVEAQQRMQDIITRYYDDIVIKFLSQYYTLALNLMLSTFSGKSKFFVDDYDFISDIKNAGGSVNADHECTFDFDKIKNSVIVNVDAGGNKVDDINNQVQQLTTFMQLMIQQTQSNPLCLMVVQNIMTRICELLGIKDYSELFETDMKNANDFIRLQVQQQMQQGGIGGEQPKPSQGMQLAQDVIGAMGNQQSTSGYQQAQAQQGLPLQQQQAQQAYQNSGADQAQ